MRFAGEAVNLGKGAITPEFYTMSDSRSLQTRKAQRYALGLSMLVAYSIVHAIKRKDDEDFQDEEEYVLDKKWTFSFDGGRTTALSIPKPRDEAFLCNMAEILAVEWMGDTTERDMKEMLATDLKARVPTGGGVIQGGFEAAINYDFFKGREVEPSYLNRRPNYARFTDKTRESSKAIYNVLSFGGKLPWLTPVKTEHLVNEFSANWYEKGHRIYDKYVTEDLSVDDSVKFLMGGKAFVVDRQSSRSITDFYDKIGEIGMKIEGNLAIEGTESDETRRLKAEYSRLNKYKAVMSSLFSMQAEEPENEGKYSKYASGLAREALGYEPHTRSPSPLQASSDSLPPKVVEAIDDLMRGIVNPAIRVSGLPEKLPKKQKDMGMSLFDYRSQERDKIDSNLEYIQENISKPMVRRYLQMELESGGWARSLGRKIGFGEGDDKMSREEAREDLSRHSLQRQRVFDLMQSIK
jgi:hypothetical protein